MASRRLYYIVLITVLSSLLLHLIFLIFFATHHMHMMHALPTPAELIFVDTSKKNNLPPQKKPSERVTLAAKTANEFAFDPAQIKEPGLPYAPPQETILDTRDNAQKKANQQIADLPEKQTKPTHQQHQRDTAPDNHIEAQAPLASPEKRSEPLEENSQTIATTKLDDTPETLELPNKSTAITPPTNNLPYPANLLKRTTAPAERAHKTKVLPTAAQLTSGFIAHLQNNNTGSAITTRGEARTRMPTAQELVLERYIEKLKHCFMCYTMTQDIKLPRVINTDSTAETNIAITYNRKNKTHSAHLYSSSGYQEFDNYCLSFFQKTCNNLPAAPSSLEPDADLYSVVFFTPVPVISQKSNFINSWQGHQQ